LETPSRDALIKLLSHLSLTRNPLAPQELSGKQKKTIKRNPEYLKLVKKRDNLCVDLIVKFGKINWSHGTSDFKEYEIV
jgi:hypothetical protein